MVQKCCNEALFIWYKKILFDSIPCMAANDKGNINYLILVKSQLDTRYQLTGTI